MVLTSLFMLKRWKGNKIDSSEKSCLHSIVFLQLFTSIFSSPFFWCCFCWILHRRVSRCVCIVDASLTKDRMFSCIIPPQTFSNSSSIFCLQLNYGMFVCPENKCKFDTIPVKCTRKKKKKKLFF